VDEMMTVSVEAASDAKVLIISVAARMAGMHPQTLRQYDRLGLVAPGRAAGGGRRYSVRDVVLLREIQRLSQDDGVNLAGIKRIIGLEQLADELQQRVAALEAELTRAYDRIAELEVAAGYPRRDLVPTAPAATALVVWRPARTGVRAREERRAAEHRGRERR
jgi:MerR family transcriptional regulator/heat shock protein HspR